MGTLLGRIAATLPVMGVVAVIVFLLIHLSPGDPAALIAGDLASTDDIARLRTTLGLDQPLWTQFALWAARLAHGDLGTSIFTQVPVTQLLAQRLEPTLSIALLTMAISIVVAIPLGTLAAHRAGSWIDRAVMVFAVLAFSVPVFLIGYLLIWGFAIELQWLPVQGYTRLAEGFGPWLAHLVLPCVNLALVYMALLTRMTRATVLEVLQEDYIRTARAKGLSERTVIYKHAFRNALVNVVPVIGIEAGFVLGGAVYIETVFQWPGIGRMLVQAISTRDILLVQGGVLLIAVAYVFINLVTDLAQSVLDPRIRQT